MADKIKIDYQLADEMVKTFQQGSEQLQQTLREMQGIASTMEGGALLGNGGNAFTDAIRTKLCPAIDKLNQKFLEMAKDVEFAANKMREADERSGKMFR